jgi:energy-converting hydrogenase Eha subunit C
VCSFYFSRFVDFLDLCLTISRMIFAPSSVAQYLSVAIISSRCEALCDIKVVPLVHDEALFRQERDFDERSNQ